jgi:hypothetical protein
MMNQLFDAHHEAVLNDPSAARTPPHGPSAISHVCTPRPRERLTLVKRGKRIDAEFLYHGEYGVELQLAHEGVMAYAQRWSFRADALEDAEDERRRLLREGWTPPFGAIVKRRG